MIGFPTPISGLGFTPILPWLPELEHLPPKSLKRLTRVLPELQARIEHLVADLGSDHEENNEEDDGDDNDDDDGSNRMDVGDSPSKRSSVGSGVPGSGEPAYIKTGIKVRFRCIEVSQSSLKFTILKCDRCRKLGRDCFIEEGAAEYSRCWKCHSDRKGCKYFDARAIAKGETPPSELSQTTKDTRTKKDGKRKVAETPEMTIPVAGPSQPKPKPTKRHKPNEVGKPTAPTPSTDRNQVIVYRPRNKPPPRPTPVITSVPASPTFSFDVVEPTRSAGFPTPSLEPPPSIIGTSSTTSSTTSYPLSLEIAILRSQLEGVNDSLRREREQSQVDRDRHREEIRSLEEQFGRERQAYQDFIKSFESGGHP